MTGLADSAGTPWEGRDLRSNPFAGDDGSADPALEAALQAYVPGDVLGLEEVVRRLASARVLIPILAELEASTAGVDGIVADKEASAGVVALEAPDGRRALPVFTSVATMAAWRAEARPVPAMATRAALSAVAEDWALLVVDPAGPVTVLVPRPAVWAIARDRTWVPAVGSAGVVDAEVHLAIVAALTGIPHVGRVGTAPGRTSELAVVLGLDPGLDRAGLDVVLAQVNARIAAIDIVGERVDSVELRVGRA